MGCLQGACHRGRWLGWGEEIFDDTIADHMEVRVDGMISICIFFRVLRDTLAGLVDALVDHDAWAAVSVGVASDVVFLVQVIEAELRKFRFQ